MQHFRFHLLGLAHLPCSKQYLACAFTQKNHKLARMLLSLGHDVFYYGVEGSDVPCTEFIQTHTLNDIRRDYGTKESSFEIGYDWTTTEFRHDLGKKHRNRSTLLFYSKCIQEILKRRQDDDFLLLTQGFYHKRIKDAIKLPLSCEPGVGYRGSLKGGYRAFESSYLQNFIYGSEAPFSCLNGSFYDRVIPNFFDPDDVEFSAEKDDYYLYIGRIINRKGIGIAIQTCNALGKRLLIAGQGAEVCDGRLVSSECDFAPGTWEYVGYVDVTKRKRLMARAIATFTPTVYLECFAGTHVESMLSGTPPITTNFGVFPGTIPDCVNGKVGFRCNTLQDFVDAAIWSQSVDRYVVRKYGERFLMDNVKYEYQKWFEDLYQLHLSKTNPTIRGRHHLGNGDNHEVHIEQ